MQTDREQILLISVSCDGTCTTTCSGTFEYCIDLKECYSDFKINVLTCQCST